jgi:hypothetical protein
MSSDFTSPSVIDPLVDGLTSLSREFAESFDRAPTAAEFVQTLGEVIKWSREGLVSDINDMNLESLQVRLSNPAKDLSQQRVRLSELPDAVLALSCNLMWAASDRLRKIGGMANSPTLQTLCEALVAAIRLCPETLLADAVPSNIAEIVPALKKRGEVKVTTGDIVAVPVENAREGFYVACVLTKNRFGTAYGFFQRNREIFTGSAALSQS